MSDCLSVVASAWLLPVDWVSLEYGHFFFKARPCRRFRSQALPKRSSGQNIRTMETQQTGSMDCSEQFDQELQAVLAPPGQLCRMNTASVDIDQGVSQNASAAPQPSGEAAPHGPQPSASPPQESKEKGRSKEPLSGVSKGGLTPGEF